MIRQLFAVLIHFCQTIQPQKLWENHKEGMAEDILYRRRKLSGNSSLQFNESIFNQALILVEDRVLLMGGMSLDKYGMVPPKRRTSSAVSSLMHKETSYDQNDLLRQVEERLPMLTEDQEVVFTTIIDAVERKEGGTFFLDAPGTKQTVLITMPRYFTNNHQVLIFVLR